MWVLFTNRQKLKITIPLVEQFLDFAFDVADYCYVMEKGSIVMEGDVGNLDQEAISRYIAV